MNLYGKLFNQERFELEPKDESSTTEKLEALLSRSPDFKIEIKGNNAKIYRKRTGDWSRAVLVIATKHNEASKGHFRFPRSTQLFFGFIVTFLTVWTIATIAMVTLAEVRPAYWLFPLAGIAIFAFSRTILSIGYKYLQNDSERILKLLRTEFRINKTVN